MKYGTQLIEEELSYNIIGAAVEVHRYLGGPGLLENVYETSFCHELEIRGIKYARQVSIPLKYKEFYLKRCLCLDLLVEDRIIVEIKAVHNDNDIFKTQLLTYLRLSNKKLGLLINFGKKTIQEGVSRVINNTPFNLH